MLSLNLNTQKLIAFKQLTENVYADYERWLDNLIEFALVRLDRKPSRPTLPAYLPRRQSVNIQKRAFDVTVALAGLIALLPLLAVLAILVRLKLGSPIFFRQDRPGLNGKPFTLLKFRTMTDARDKQGNLLPDEQRLTRFGQLLRSTSLDELPELINVIKGEMSLVGTRPLLMEYLDLYTPEQARRQTVKPGITGWAQINGRNNTTWEERFALDVWYVDNQSLWLDIRILFLTFAAVVKRDGISQQGHVTMPRFTGRPTLSENIH